SGRLLSKAAPSKLPPVRLESLTYRHRPNPRSEARPLMRRCLALCLLLLLSPAAPAQESGPKISADVIYGRKDGMALTYDVIGPAKPSGAAILWIQSGGC